MKFWKVFGLVSSFVPPSPSPVRQVEVPRKLNRTGRILMQAADLIEERGWTQGVRETRQGYLCMIGAIEKAARRERVTFWDRLTKALPEDEIKVAAYKAVRAHLHSRNLLVPHVGPRDIWVYNDQRGRKKEEVIDVLRQSAVS